MLLRVHVYVSTCNLLAFFLQDTFSSQVSPPTSSTRSSYVKTPSCQFPVSGKSHRTSYTTGNVDGSESARKWNVRDSIGSHSQISEPISTGQQSPLEFHNSETNGRSSAYSHVHPVSRYVIVKAGKKCSRLYNGTRGGVDRATLQHSLRGRDKGTTHCRQKFPICFNQCRCSLWQRNSWSAWIARRVPLPMLQIYAYPPKKMTMNQCNANEISSLFKYKIAKCVFDKCRTANAFDSWSPTQCTINVYMAVDKFLSNVACTVLCLN